MSSGIKEGMIDPEVIDEYIARDGYAGLAKALTEMTPEDIVKEMLDSGLAWSRRRRLPHRIKMEVRLAIQKRH